MFSAQNGHMHESFQALTSSSIPVKKAVSRHVSGRKTLFKAVSRFAAALSKTFFKFSSQCGRRKFALTRNALLDHPFMSHSEYHPLGTAINPHFGIFGSLKDTWVSRHREPRRKLQHVLRSSGSTFLDADQWGPGAIGRCPNALFFVVFGCRDLSRSIILGRQRWLTPPFTSQGRLKDVSEPEQLLIRQNGKTGGQVSEDLAARAGCLCCGCEQFRRDNLWGCCEAQRRSKGR